MRLAGSVGDAVQVSAQHVRVLPGAKIRGDLIVRDPHPPEISPGVEMDGKVDYRRTEDAAVRAVVVGLWLWLFLGLLVLGLLAIAFSSVWPQRVAVTLLRSFVMSLPSVGWIALIAVVLIGMGAVILERRDFRPQLRGVGLA